MLQLEAPNDLVTAARRCDVLFVLLYLYDEGEGEDARSDALKVAALEAAVVEPAIPLGLSQADLENCARRWILTLQVLLLAGASPDAAGPSGKSPRETAVMAGERDGIAARLLQEWDHDGGVNWTDARTAQAQDLDTQLEDWLDSHGYEILPLPPDLAPSVSETTPAAEMKLAPATLYGKADRRLEEPENVREPAWPLRRETLFALALASPPPLTTKLTLAKFPPSLAQKVAFAANIRSIFRQEARFALSLAFAFALAFSPSLAEKDALAAGTQVSTAPFRALRIEKWIADSERTSMRRDDSLVSLRIPPSQAGESYEWYDDVLAFAKRNEQFVDKVKEMDQSGHRGH
ncbi:hypothetical protein RQP46_001530 [Phenoliferia psychrophenolica]